MWLKNISHGQLFVAFLLFYYHVMPVISATSIVQLKNHPPQTMAQASTTSTQHLHHSNHVTVPRKHQHTLQSGGVASHPVNEISSGANNDLHDSNTGHHNAETEALSSSSRASLANMPSPQYGVRDKEIASMQEILKHFDRDSSSNDHYQVVKELKRETPDNFGQQSPPLVILHPSNAVDAWNLYDRPYTPITLPPPQIASLFPHSFNPFESFPATPRFLPVVSYPQPMYVPYPFVMPPDMFYPSYPSLPQMCNEYEDSMSRGAGTSRRPGSTHHSSNFPRNSPIYYMRLTPTPYMFLPNLGLTSSSTQMGGYPNMLPYQSLPLFSSFSSIFNVPINFLANGKPTNIYQMITPPNDIHTSLQFANAPTSFSMRPPPPPPANAYRPAPASHSYFNAQPSTATAALNYVSYHPGSSSEHSSPLSTQTSTSSAPSSSSSSLPHQDSKLTSLKRPYFFNGRPEDIYILPNNFNTLFSSENSYY